VSGFLNGDHMRPNALSGLRYQQPFIPRIVGRIMKTAPPGADLASWRYWGPDPAVSNK